ncbi:uncharacterized protein LOC111488380 isoform X2 [Cucurbita maxima]|uniref:Uncharacterized protein LOC111488380 isoform X2 n=1 Tax=Cucurbita maxima TaxID=3661 RepID=A0A6J1JN28_CUCMA|nr:uncharacterized protein LOC111488380 isoform X2 [Cucurbita maxima]
MDLMDSMEKDNLNLRNKLSGFISDDENEESRCLGTIRSDANFNGLHEEYSAASGLHHSQFPDPSVSSHPNLAGSFSDSISYTDIDWSFDGSRLGLSSQKWSNSIYANPKNKTNASFRIRSPELASICRVPARSHEAEGIHRVTNNHNFHSAECEDQIDLNITAICSALQPHGLEELDAEALDVGCQTKATTALNKADKISGFKDNSGDIPNLTTFPQNSVGLRCSNFINFSLHQSSVFQPSIIVGGDNPFPTPSFTDDSGLTPAVVQGDEDILNSLKNAPPLTTESVNSKIELSSQCWFTDLESCLLRRDQSQRPSEQKSHPDVRNFTSEFPTFAPSLGISATISVPDQSVELVQSAGPSQPPQNVGNALASGNQDAREFGTVEDSGIAKSNPHPPVFTSSPVSANTDISFQAHLAQVLSVSVSPDITSHVVIQPQKTEIDPNQVYQPIISESVPLVSSKFEDLRDRSFRRSRTSRCYIKCRDLDQTPKLSGERCFICKRDLSFKPEGSLVLPKIPPTVAILPCSHVFHGLCLERVTPQNQAEDPPCLPCAVGDT